MQRCGIAEVSSALESEEVALILALRESKDVEVARLLLMARIGGSGYVRPRRMTCGGCPGQRGEEPPPILALVGRTQMQGLAKSCHREAFAGF